MRALRIHAVPSALMTGPRPAEREVYVKPPSSLHNERPMIQGGEQDG